MSMSRECCHFVRMGAFDNTCPAFRKVNDNFVTKERCQLLQRKIFSLLDEEVDDDATDDTKTHVQEIHAPMAVMIV